MREGERRKGEEDERLKPVKVPIAKRSDWDGKGLPDRV